MIGYHPNTILKANTARSSLISDLMKSDSEYFEAGAEITSLPGVVLVRLEGLESLAAACLAHRIDPTSVPSDVEGWLDDIEFKLFSWGARQVRIYLQQPVSRIESVFESRGYRRREEIAVLKDANSRNEFSLSVTLRRIENEEDWGKKVALHRMMEMGPDGHIATSEMWVEMERRRIDAGYMNPYLITIGDEIVGTVSAARRRKILRVKNLFVAPEFRRRKIATATIVRFAKIAATQGLAAAGAFVVSDEPAVNLYKDAGFDFVARQTEWTKPITGLP